MSLQTQMEDELKELKCAERMMSLIIVLFYVISWLIEKQWQEFLIVNYTFRNKFYARLCGRAGHKCSGGGKLPY